MLLNVSFWRGQTNKQKNPPNNWDEKEFLEGKKFKQVIKGKHKTYKEWKRGIGQQGEICIKSQKV